MKLTLPTVEEIEKIKNGDIEIISAYYLQNLTYIKRYVVSFCRRIRDYSEFDDFIQEIYINFSKLSFENERYFGHDCFKVFCNYYYGDSRKREQMKSKHGVSKELYILDSPVKGLEKQGDTVGDVIPDKVDILDKVYPKPCITESLFDFLSNGLAKQQKRVFEQFYYTGKTYNEIAQTLGKSPKTVKRTREEIFKKFRSRLNELQEFLTAQNYEFNVISN